MRSRALVLIGSLAALLSAPITRAQTAPVTYTDDFQSYGEHANPPGWIDSSVGTPKPQAAGLYKTWGDPTQGNKATNVVYGTKQASGKADPAGRMGTFSTYSAKTFSGTGRFEYRGRFIRTTSDARIGLTFFSSYPDKDSYYLAGLMPETDGTLTMQLLAFGAGTPSGTIDSKFSPDPNKWYWFDIQADALTSETHIRARFWLDGSTEPTTWSIDASDTSAARLTQGRIGTWAAIKGESYIDDLAAKSPVDHTPPSIAFFESNQSMTNGQVFGRDAAPEIRVTDDSSGVATVTIKLDGNPYVSKTPVTTEQFHDLAVDAVDNAGNAAHAAIRFAVDKTAPTLAILDSATPITDGAVFNHDVKPVIKADDLTPVTTTVTLDGAPFTTGTVVSTEQKHTIAASATDAAGHTTSGTVSFTIDKSGPSLTVTSPKPGDVLTDTTVVISGTSDDAVSLQINGVPAAKLDTAAHTFTSQPIALAEGNNTINLSAVDAAGNSGKLAVTFALDTRAPQLAVTAPADGACLNADAIDLHGTVSDAHPKDVSVAFNGTTIAATLDATGSWSAHVPGLVEGPAVFVITATDTVGHVASVTRRVSIDHTAPDIDINQSGAAFVDTLVNHPVTLTVDVTDADPHPAVTMTLDGQPFVSGTPIVAEGSHTLSASATDCAGLKTDRKVTFTIDTTAPAIDGFVPANGATVGAAPAAIHANASEAATISVAGTAMTATTTAAGGFDLTGATLVEGVNRFTIHAVDQAGNAVDVPYSVTLRTSVPSVSITDNGVVIGANALFNRAVTPVIRSSAADATISATLDGQPFTSGTKITAEGAHTLSATATDPVGHSGSATATFTIDTTAPVIRITSPANGAKVQGDSIAVTGNAGDAVSVTVNGAPVTLAADGGFSTTVSIEPGDNAIVAAGRDRAGNGGSAQITVTRDDLAAGLVLTQPTATITNRKTTVVAGRILTPANAKSLTIGSQTVAFDPTGAFLVADYPLVEGVNTITATLTAMNGRTTTATATITADLTPPTVRILANGQPLDDGARFAGAVSLSADASDGTLELRLDGSVVNPPANVSATGSHTAIATAVDAAGNSARITRSFSIGAQAGGGGCSLTQFDPAGGSVVGASSVTITGLSGGAAGVKINGVPAQVANGSFSGTAELTQEGSNTISIVCTDAAGNPTGSAATLTLIRATNAPSISITAPAEMASFSTPAVAVTGTIGAGVVAVDINGAAATISGSTFSGNATLTAGLNVIVAHAKNAAGAVASASRRVVYLKNAPAISINWPGAGFTTGAASVDVGGTYANLDPSTLRAALGGTPETHISSETSGTFVIHNVPLAAGAQDVVITGSDALGRGATATVNVTRDSNAPSIAISTPANNSYAGSASIGVTGTFTAATGAQVDVAGSSATLNGNAFTATATLGASGAPTPVVARVTQPDGASAIATADVTLLSGAPSVKEVFPAADAVAVDPGVIVLVSFSAPMDRATLDDGFVLLDGAGTAVSGQRRLDRDVLSFAPATTLTPGQRYTALIRTTAKDLAGNAIASEVRSSFTIATSAPSEAPHVDAIASPVCASTITISGTAPASSRVEINIGGIPQYATADATGHFSAQVSIPSQSGYRVARVRVIGSDGSDSPAADAGFQIDCAGPSVTGAAYDRNANAISVTFSKAIDITTAAGAIALKLDDGTAVTSTVAAGASNSALVITPGTPDPRTKNLVLTIATSLKDTTGRALAAPYTTTFTLTSGGSSNGAGNGQGYVSGQVFDATNGRPLANVNLAITPGSGAKVTEANGQYTFVVDEGAFTIHAWADGYTDVWRQVVVPAGAGIIPIDIRLTARGAKQTAGGAALTLTHGGDDAIARKATLTVPAASAPAGTAITLTSVGAQSLGGLLPLGWSPLAAAEVRLAWSGTPVANAVAQLAFDLPAEAAASGKSFAAVEYDATRDEWRVLQPVVAITSNSTTLTINLPATLGSYAVVYADAGAGLAVPPAPTSGAVLAGVHDPCATTACPPMTAKAPSLNPPIVPPNGVTVATFTMDGTSPYPSGTAVQAFVNEELRLTDGSVDVSQPFSTDLVLYRSLAGDTASASFHLAPSAHAANVPLQVGFDHIQVFPYPGRLDRGTLVGPAGGPIPGDDRVQVDVPAGAASTAIHATAASMSAQDLGQIHINGFTVVAGFTLTMSEVGGQAPSPVLLKPATATFTIDASSATSQMLVAEILGDTPYGRVFRMAANANAPLPVDGTTKVRVVTAPIDPGKLPVDGIIRAGQYLLLAAQQPVAFAFGSVRLGAQGGYVNGARVDTATLGVSDVSRPAGLFVIPVLSAPAAPFTLTPSHPSTGTGIAYTAPAAPAASANVAVGDLVLTSQPPQLQHVNVVTANGGADLVAAPARDVVLSTSVQAVFSQTLDAASVSASSISVADASGKLVAGSTTAAGATLTWTSTAALAPNASYVVTISGLVRGQYGAPLGASQSFGFNTVTFLTNAQINASKIHITIPDASGTSTIFGEAGALPTVPPEPKAWRAVALRRGNAFTTQYQATANADGSFSFTVSGITINDRIDLEILNAADNIAAVLPLGPFVSADGQAFVAPADSDVTFTSRDGVSVRVPAGSFDQPTVVRTARLDNDAAFANVPNIHNELNFYRGVQLTFDCGDCTAHNRLDVTIPVPAGTDTSRNFLLGWLGDSVRGPRVMVVDTLRIDNGNFTTAPAPGAALKTQTSRVHTNEVLSGNDVKKFLVGVNRSGIYNVIDIRVPEGTNAGWAAMDSMQGNYDLFWDEFSSLFASHLYLAESHGRIVIPVLTNRQFQLVGYDAGTGLQAFSKVYNPLPNGDPGAAYIVDDPVGSQIGPYPVYALPNRVELIDLEAENVDITSIRNFTVKLQGGIASVRDADPQLPADTELSLLNVTSGEWTSTRGASGIAVPASIGDRLMLVVGGRNVDPETPLSVVFSRPLYLGGASTADAIDTYLHTVITFERAAKPVSGASPVYTDISGMARFGVDSSGRRLTITLPSELERGAFYRINLTSSVAAAMGSGAGLGLGQVSGTTPSSPMNDAVRLVFQVRDVPDPLTSFNIGSGSIRDLSLNGNILLMSAGSGGILAYDAADPASLSDTSTPIGRVTPNANEYWAVASDQHGRVYTTGINGIFGFIQSYRLESLAGTTAAPKQVATPRGAATVCWIPGSTAGADLGLDTVLSDRPEGLPRRLQIAVQDNDIRYDNLSDFLSGITPLATSVTPVPAGNGFTKITANIKREAGYPYRDQRITIENLTRDMRWSGDAIDNTPATIDNIIARDTDQLRIVYNERTYGIVTIFGYGAGVFDLNAMESNDAPNAPAGAQQLSERVRLTKGEITPECGIPAGAGGIESYEFSPEIAVIPQANPALLKIYGPDVRSGVLDENIPLNTTTAIAPGPVCDDRSPNGLLLTPTMNMRLGELESKFQTLAGRAPFHRFGGAQTYHWILEAQDNKAVAPAPSPTSQAPGQRDSIAGTRVERDYLLVPGYEYGLLVIDASHPVTNWLTAQNLADVIWIPGGAVAVRVIPRTHYATVVDAAGRVLLVDLSRIDERYNAGAAIADNALFPTASAALNNNGAYGVGTPDPRILWASQPGLAGGSLAPVIDSDTGILFAGQLQGTKTTVVAVGDPRIEMRADTGNGSLAEVGGVVPLGVDPPAGILNASDPNASLGAFRLELTLPGGVAEKLNGAQLRLAVESERVAGAPVEQTPAPFPRANLRMTDKSGANDPRPAAGFVLQRDLPPGMDAVLRTQKGYNKFISPWIVAIADPRASIGYSGFDNTASTCSHCTRPQRLANLDETQGVWELWSGGRQIAVRPEVCGNAITGCSGISTIFAGTKYAYLADHDGLTTRFPTVMADTVRTPAVLTAGQAAPVATGAILENVYLHSGELSTARVDLSAGGRAGWTVDFDRTYRSRTMVPGFFGRGWESSIFRRIRALPNGNVEYRDGSGEVWLFRPPTAAGQPYVAPSGLFLNLVRTDNGWQIIDQKRRVSTFDDLGRLVTESDEFGGAGYTGEGNTIRYLYDGNGRLVQIIDPVSRAAKIAYWDNTQPGWKAGRVQTITDWRGRAVDYDYDSDGRMLTAALPDVANSDGGRPTIKYGYDPVSPALTDNAELGTLLKTITDPSGGSTPRVTFGYGTGADRGKLKTQAWATNEQVLFSYGPGTATSVDALLQLRNYTLTPQPSNAYDDRAHIHTLTETGVTTSSTPVGQLPASVGPSGYQTSPADRVYTFEYENGALKSTTLDGVLQMTVGYNSVSGAPGLIPTSINATPLTAPGAGMPASAAQPIAQTLNYGSGGDPLFLSSVTTNNLTINAPEASRAQKNPIATNDGVNTSSTYDDFGQLKSVVTNGGTDSASAGSSTTIQYKPDTANEWERGLPYLIDNGGSLTQISYLDQDTVITINPRNVLTTTKSDAWGRPVDVLTSGPELTLHEMYSYDANGRLHQTIRIQGPRTVTTTFTYDALGRTTSVATDNVVVDGAQTTQSTTTTYDLTNHTLTTTLAPNGPTTTTTLDTLGRTITSSTATGQTPILRNYAYDKAGNVVYEADNFVAVAHAYDAHGRRIATLYQDGTQDVLDHDALGRTTETTSKDNTGATIAHAKADITPAGHVLSTKVDLDAATGNATISDFKWDGAGRITRGGVKPAISSSSSGDLRAMQRIFDAAGRVRHDEAGAGDTNGVTDRFSVSDVTSFINLNSALPQSVLRKERTGSTYTQSFDYDTNGNTTKAILGSLKWEQHFDEAGNVTKAAEPNRQPTTANYDARGAATDQTEPGNATTKFTWNSTGALKDYIDPHPEATTSDNDLAGRPLKRTYADHTFEQFVWNGPRLASYTDRQGKTQTFGYNSRNQLESIREPAGAELDHIDYDSAGRVLAWTNRDSKIEYLAYDLQGHPLRTRTTRYAPGTGLSSKQILDVFEQTHTWNAHGERTQWQMPRPAGFSAAGWTDTLFEDHDAAGNVSSIARTFFGGTSSTPVPLMTASFRNAGRPDLRTVTTTCVAGAACTAADIARKYAYDPVTSQLNEMRVTAGGVTVAGAHIGFDGLQINDVQILGVSGEERHSRFTYDSRSRLSGFAYGSSDPSTTPAPGAPGTATVTQSPAGFVSAINRTPSLDAGTRAQLAAKGIDVSRIDPTATTATETAGHKIDTVTTGSVARTFTYTGALRADDGRHTFTWDEKGRLTAVTEKPGASTATPIRRIDYYFDGNDRMIGRRAEYSTDGGTSWKLEDRPGVLANEGLPADVTFAWDPISDTLVEVWEAGTGKLLKQIVHGGLAYDDPIEVTFPNPISPTNLARLYPVFDEAGTASLQAVLNVNGQVVARNVPGDAFGAENEDLAGAAVDRVAITATKDNTGNLQSIEVTVRTTEALRSSTLASGLRLASVDANGKVVATSTATPTLADAYTARFALTPADWSALTTASSAASLSVAVKATLRAAAWADIPILPPPDWAKATQPVYSTPDTPVELRESLASLNTWLAGVSGTDTRKLYEIENLSLAGSSGGGSEGVLDQVMASRFQALPFSDPATGLVYARARWYDPETGTWLSPDPNGYEDSSNLYAYTGGDAVNGRDPRGEISLRAALTDGVLNEYELSTLELTKDEIKSIIESIPAMPEPTDWWGRLWYTRIIPKNPTTDPEGAERQARLILLLRNRSFQQYSQQLYELTRGLNPLQFTAETSWAIGSGYEPVIGTKVDRGEKLFELVTYLAFLKGTQWVNTKLAQVRATAVGDGPIENMDARWKALSKERTRQGVPPAQHPADEATFAQLEIDGAAFEGRNSALQEPKTPITLERVNAQTKTHAEAEAVQKALNAGKYGKAQVAEMWVDRAPCSSCGKFGGLRSLARNLGVQKLIVHTPEGSIVVTPTN
jgi:RHS repeat-associated protein